VQAQRKEANNNSRIDLPFWIFRHFEFSDPKIQKE